MNQSDKLSDGSARKVFREWDDAFREWYRDLREMAESRIIRHDLTIRPEWITREDTERFLKALVVGRESECWWWRGGLSEKGYGRFQFRGRTVAAHVFAWVLQFGKWPAPVPDAWGTLRPFIGCHHCDSKACCNPLHLYPGTHEDNARDFELRGTPERYRAGRAGNGR